MKKRLSLEDLFKAVEATSASFHNPYAYQSGFYSSVLKELAEKLHIEEALADRYSQYTKDTLQLVAVPTESL